MSLRHLVAVVASATLLACHANDAHEATLRMPAGSAGEILARAIGAAGGWQRWSELRDVSFVSSTAFFHPLAGEVRESLGLYKIALHHRARGRFESLGSSERVAVGMNGEEIWLEREGILECDPPSFTLARLHLTGNMFWISLPFSLVDPALHVTDAGDRSEGGRTWRRLRVEAQGSSLDSVDPVDWFVVYFDAETGLIDRVLGHVTAPFLAHPLWVGVWRDYRNVSGIHVAYRRDLFPADANADPIGPRALDQIVDEVRFGTGLPSALFEKPIPQPCRP